MSKRLGMSKGWKKGWWHHVKSVRLLSLCFCIFLLPHTCQFCCMIGWKFFLRQIHMFKKKKKGLARLLRSLNFGYIFYRYCRTKTYKEKNCVIYMLCPHINIKLWRLISIHFLQTLVERSCLKLKAIFFYAGCKESQFYSLPFGQAITSMY